MTSDIFDSLFREHVDVFRAAFTSTATAVFYDPDTKRLRHTGEYGGYRESIVRDFLKFIVPRGRDISSGFVITSMNDVSTQCDVIVFDSRMTPLYTEGDRQRFFPVESTFCIGEVKSTLSRNEFAEALNKLATIKALGERIPHPAVAGKAGGNFAPANHPYDLVPSILLCQKLDFNLSDIAQEIDAMYESKVLHRHKHNMILSINDGLLSYVAQENMTIPYPRLAQVDLPHRFTSPTQDSYAHFNLFGSFMFMLTANKTLLYPEFSDYIGSTAACAHRDQRQ